MSLFSTLLPLDLKAFQSLLDGVAPGGQVETLEIAPDKSGVIIQWHCHNLNSRVSFPTQFPIDDLKAKELPAGVVAQVTPSPNPVLPPPPPKPTPLPPKPSRPPDPNFKDPAPMPKAKEKKGKGVDKVSKSGDK